MKTLCFMSILPTLGRIVGVLYRTQKMSVYDAIVHFFLLCVLIVHVFCNYYSIKCKILFPINVSLFVHHWNSGIARVIVLGGGRQVASGKGILGDLPPQLLHGFTLFEWS